MECVQKTRQVGAAIKARDWDKVVQLRGPTFKVKSFTPKALSTIFTTSILTITLAISLGKLT